MNESAPNNDRVAGHAQTLLGATLYFLSLFAATRSPRVATLIEQHLGLLATHSDADPLIRSTCAQLLARHWTPATRARVRFQQENTTSGQQRHQKTYPCTDIAAPRERVNISRRRRRDCLDITWLLTLCAGGLVIIILDARIGLATLAGMLF